MPIYEYQCDHCGKLTEVFGQTANTAGPPAACACGKEPSFSKIFSVFSAQSPSAFTSMGECGPSDCEAAGGGRCGGGQCMHGH